jgi:hypothetical protein
VKTVIGVIGDHGPELVRKRRTFAVFSMRCRGDGTFLLVHVAGAARAAEVVNGFQTGDAIRVTGEEREFVSSASCLTKEIRASRIERLDATMRKATADDDLP